MSAFQAVNTTTISVPDPSIPRSGGETTPTTPRPGQFFPRDKPVQDHRPDDSTIKTPTRDSFANTPGPMLPRTEADPPSDEAQSLQKSLRAEPKRENSNNSIKSEDSHDVEMGDNDEENHDGSDDEDGDLSDSSRPSKKKKGMRFFCTEFPPCALSFTRSEHLARHIRKHTGERPFQCHCSRRFSRLDNLRQHAQTVHVNEDIPGDSLAATGTRFQRQIRTDRVRPTHRSRASTTSIGGHSRGHSRNLSTSSIASTASTMSQISSISQRDDSFGRRRPLAMANESGHSRGRLSLDTFNPPLMGSPGPTIQSQPYGSQSPNLSTPTSATYSNTGSPRFRSAMQSPGMSNARPLTWAGAPTAPSRRLSVPSGPNPFQGPPSNAAYPPPFITHMPSSSASYSQNTSTVASPTSSVFSIDRRDSTGGPESDWRRRTWHPGTYQPAGPRPATSGLGYYQAADAAQPSFTTQPAATQMRLPGIESFDHAPPSSLLARRQPSPMHVGEARPPPLAPPFEPMAPHRPEHRRNNHSLDLSLQRGIHRLDIANATPPQQAWREPQHSFASTTSRPTTAPHSGFPLQPGPASGPHPQVIIPSYSEAEKHSLEVSPSSRRAKRQAWYNGPLEPSRPSMAAPPHPASQHQRTSPEDSSSSEGVPTPSASSVPEYHPAIVQSNGTVERYHAAPVPDHSHNKSVYPAPPYGASHHRAHSSGSLYAGPPPANPVPFGYQIQPLQSIPQGRPEPPNDTRNLDVLVAAAEAARAG